MLKNMTIGKKLTLGFGVVLLLLTLVGFLSFRGVGRMGANAKDAIAKNELIDTLTRREIDHLDWANQLVALLVDDNLTQLTVQTDDHQCAFGKWLYSEQRQHAEQEIPELAAIFKEIEGHHHDLHQSAVEIGASFRQADEELPTVLAMCMAEHLAWADTIHDAILENAASLDMQTDPGQCAFGQWLAGEQGQRTYRGADVELKRSWDDLLLVHRRLHESAAEVGTRIGQGEQGRAQARQVFEEKSGPMLRDMLQRLGTMKTSADRALAGMHQANDVYATKTRPCLHKVQELIGEATECVEGVVARTNEDMMALARFTKASVTILSVVAVLAGIAAAILVGRSIISALKQIIANLREGAEQVASASTQVSAASQSLAEGATEQAAGLQETSSSLEEMSSMTKQNADNAQQANTLAAEAKRAAATGSESMGRMNGAIRDIQKSSDETAKIIKVIDEIAFQTNLLALNAAVEAARAGEAGKGFAVVAEEVRNLAMRSAEAAKNTAGMIEESVKNSKNGVDIATEVGKVLEEIVQSVGKTTDLVSEIAAASQEQAQGIDQVNTAVAQMDKVTQQNAANAEESASASEELSAQAASMQQIVGELMTLVGGSRAATPATAGARLERSDEAFHQIADRARTNRAGSRELLPSRVGHAIPLDDSSDLSDFNR